MASRHAQTGKENSTLQRLRRKSGDSSKEDASTSYRLQPAASSSSAAPQENNNPLVARKPLATLSSAPVMPSFDIAEDEEDDPEEESHLINVLQKLQNAKRNIDSSRHK